jgi:hypothetical protein
MLFIEKISKKIIYYYLSNKNCVLNYNEDYLIYNNDALITFIYCDKSILNSKHKKKIYRDITYF